MLKQSPILSVLILLVYYNRPLLVRNALTSILKSHTHFPHWSLAVLDDGSEFPAESTVKDVLADHKDKVTFYNSHVTFEEKMELGVTVGRLANRAILESSAPLCVTLCDDDELHPYYLKKLSRYFQMHEEVRYCYSNIYLYNPLIQKSEDVNFLTGPYNKWSEPIECYGKVDGSQVALHTSCMKRDGIWWLGSTANFEYGTNPFLGSLDGELFKQFYNKYGPAPYTGFVSQYKGVHEHQMVFIKEWLLKDKDDLIEFHETILENAGKLY